MRFSAISRRAFSMRARRSSIVIGTMPSVIGRSARIDGGTCPASAAVAAAPDGRWRPARSSDATPASAAAAIRHPRRHDRLAETLRRCAFITGARLSLLRCQAWCGRRDRQHARLRQPRRDRRRGRPSSTAATLRRLPMSASGSALRITQVGELAGFDRAEVVEAARGDGAVARRGDDRLRRASCRARPALRWP